MTDLPTQLTCMEVWGDSEITESGIQMGGLDAWVYSKPYGQAQRGGDVYYASSCATGRINRLLLADVSGHGSVVEATAADLRRLMRRFVNRLDQTDFVRLLNEQFSALSGGSFATAVVTTFFEPSRRLTICNAGHPRPLLYRKSENEWTLLTQEIRDEKHGVRNVPLGLLAISEYEQFDIELETGDCLLSYTDALIESRGADGEMLGENGVLGIVNSLRDVEPPKLIHALLKAIAHKYPENLSADDVTVLLVRANGRPAEYSLKDKFSALVRFVSTFARSLEPGRERAPFPDFNLANIGGAIIPALGRRWRRKPAAQP